MFYVDIREKLMNGDDEVSPLPAREADSDRIAKEELRQHWLSLCRWLTPNDFHTALGAVSPPSEQLFNDGFLNYFPDAYVADVVATSLKVEAVRLLNDSWPDFQTKIEGRVVGWEMTEADLPDRKRGKEFREAAEHERTTGKPLLTEDRVEQWHERAALIPDAIEQAVKLKIDKRYSTAAARQLRLVILLQIHEWDIAQREVEECMAERTSMAKNVFGEVWIIWKTKLYRVWAGGRAVMEVVPMDVG